MKLDLENRSLRDLQELHKTVNAAIESARAKQREAVQKKVAKIVADAGFKISELFPAKRPHKRAMASSSKKDSVLHINPDNPSQTWSGRGRRPHWMAK